MISTKTTTAGNIYPSPTTRKECNCHCHIENHTDCRKFKLEYIPYSCEHCQPSEEKEVHYASTTSCKLHQCSNCSRVWLEKSEKKETYKDDVECPNHGMVHTKTFAPQEKGTEGWEEELRAQGSLDGQFEDLDDLIQFIHKEIQEARRDMLTEIKKVMPKKLDDTSPFTGTQAMTYNLALDDINKALEKLFKG